MGRRAWRIVALLLLMTAVMTAIVDDSLDNDLSAMTMPEAALAAPPDVLACFLAPADAGLVTRDVHDAFHPPRLG